MNPSYILGTMQAPVVCLLGSCKQNSRVGSKNMLCLFITDVLTAVWGNLGVFVC